MAKATDDPSQSPRESLTVRDLRSRFFIACYNRDTDAYQGVVKPASLVFDHAGEALLIAGRYAKAYPSGRWTALELDPHGRRIKDHELPCRQAVGS